MKEIYLVKNIYDAEEQYGDIHVVADIVACFEEMYDALEFAKEHEDREHDKFLEVMRLCLTQSGEKAPAPDLKSTCWEGEWDAEGPIETTIHCDLDEHNYFREKEIEEEIIEKCGAGCIDCPFGNGEGGCTSDGCEFEEGERIPTAREWVDDTSYVGD